MRKERKRETEKEREREREHSTAERGETCVGTKREVNTACRSVPQREGEGEERERKKERKE